MTFRAALIPCGVTLCLVVASSASNSEAPVKPATDAKVTNPDASNTTEDESVSVAVARDRAKVMHRIYTATLHVMHDRYFHGDRAIVPARAMEDVFSAIQDETKTEARWISVNLKPMSLDHEPKSEFEKQAAREISRGKQNLESVDDGYFQRAIAIPLGSNCISCHGGFFKKPSKKPKFAALVIRIPVKNEPPDAN